jgi:hypothetical protein
MRQIELLDPTGVVHVTERPLATRRGSLRGKRIGFLSNKKANATRLLRETESLLRERIGDFASTWGEKGAAVPAAAEVMEDLSRCDAVVTAIAD